MSGNELSARDEAARSAFDNLFVRHHTELCRLVYLLSGDQRVAEEIVADAFAEAWRRWEPGTGVDAQLASVRRNTIRIATNRVHALADVRAGEAVADTREALAKLPSVRRACVVLSHFCELPEYETAKTLGLSEVAVGAETSRGVSDVAAMRGAAASTRWIRSEITVAAFEYEPDTARLHDLVAERVTLAPQHETTAATVEFDGAVASASTDQNAPGAPDRRRTTRGFGRLGRRGQACIALGTIAAVTVLVVEFVTPGSGAGNDHQAAFPISDSSVTPGSLQVGAVGSVTPTRSASASANTTPTASAEPSHTATSSAVVATTATSSTQATASNTAPQAVSAAASVSSGSDSTWTQLDLDVTIKQTLTAMTVTIQVAHCRNLTAAEAWDSGAGGAFIETTTQDSNGSITYEFDLSSSEATPSTVTFAVQFSHASSGWSASADTFDITGETSDSADVDLSGSY